MKKLLAFLMLLAFAVLPSQTNAQVIHYVTPGGTGNGTSWNDPGDLISHTTCSDCHGL